MINIEKDSILVQKTSSLIFNFRFTIWIEYKEKVERKILERTHCKEKFLSEEVEVTDNIELNLSDNLFSEPVLKETEVQVFTL